MWFRVRDPEFVVQVSVFSDWLLASRNSYLISRVEGLELTSVFAVSVQGPCFINLNFRRQTLERQLWIVNTDFNSETPKTGKISFLEKQIMPVVGEAEGLDTQMTAEAAPEQVSSTNEDDTITTVTLSAALCLVLRRNFLLPVSQPSS